MNKHFLSKTTRNMLIGTLGAIGCAVMPLGSAQASDTLARLGSLEFGEAPTVYPGSSQDIQARQHAWQAAPLGAQGPVRSDMTSEAGYSTSSAAAYRGAQSGMSWTERSPRSGMFGEQPTEYK